MSALIANQFLTQIRNIHNDMDSVTFFKNHEESSAILKELDEMLIKLEEQIQQGIVIGMEGFVRSVKPILQKMIQLYQHSFTNLSQSHSSDGRLKNLANLISEYEGIANHFSYMQIASAYSHIQEIDNLFKLISKK